MDNNNYDNILKRLTYNQKDFFDKLSFYIDKPIHFYGSIQRSDYIPGKSDIDIDIFTDNESSTIQMVCSFLHIPRNKFRKTVYKINSQMVYGYKGKYDDEKNGINVEISIYNNKYKELVLDDHNKCQYLPIYITIVLFIVKILFYKLNLISKQTYKRCKRFLMNPGDEFKFIEMDE